MSSKEIWKQSDELVGRSQVFYSHEKFLKKKGDFVFAYIGKKKREKNCLKTFSELVFQLFEFKSRYTRISLVSPSSTPDIWILVIDDCRRPSRLGEAS